MGVLQTKSFIIPGRGALIRIPDGCCRLLVIGGMRLPEMARRKIRIMTPFIRIRKNRIDIISHIQISETELDKKGSSKMWKFFLMVFGAGHPITMGDNGRPVVDMSLVTGEAGHPYLFDEKGLSDVLEALLTPRKFKQAGVETTARGGEYRVQSVSRPQVYQRKPAVFRVPQGLSAVPAVR